MKIVELLAYFEHTDKVVGVDVYEVNDDFVVMMNSLPIQNIYVMHDGRVELGDDAVNVGNVKSNWNVRIYVDVTLRSFKVTESVHRNRL